MSDSNSTQDNQDEAQETSPGCWAAASVFCFPPIGLYFGALGLGTLNDWVDRIFFHGEWASDDYGLLFMVRAMFGSVLGAATGLALALIWNRERRAASLACLVGAALALLVIAWQTSGATAAGESVLYTLRFYDNLALVWVLLLLVAAARLSRPRASVHR